MQDKTTGLELLGFCVTLLGALGFLGSIFFLVKSTEYPESAVSRAEKNLGFLLGGISLAMLGVVALVVILT